MKPALSISKAPHESYPDMEGAGDNIEIGLSGRLATGASKRGFVGDVSSTRRAVSCSGGVPNSARGHGESVDSGDGNGTKAFSSQHAFTGEVLIEQSHVNSLFRSSSGPVYCAIEQSLRCILSQND